MNSIREPTDFNCEPKEKSWILIRIHQCTISSSSQLTSIAEVIITRKEGFLIVVDIVLLGVIVQQRGQEP